MKIDRIIIFDMDGTLYDLDDVVSMNYEMQVEFLSMKKNMSREEAVSYLAENSIFSIITKESKSATEFFLQIGFDKKEWTEYREKHFDVSKIKKEKALDDATIRRFVNYGTLVLLTSNSYANIQRILDYLEISLDNFTEVICSDHFPYSEQFQKKLAMHYLAEKYQIPFSSLLSIGDRFSTDIQPIIDLGGKGVLIKKPSNLKILLSDLGSKRLRSNIAYEYYQ